MDKCRQIPGVPRRIIRPEKPVPIEQSQDNATPEERINAVGSDPALPQLGNQTKRMNQDFRDISAESTPRRVEFILVGAHAFAAHWFRHRSPRFSISKNSTKPADLPWNKRETVILCRVDRFRTLSATRRRPDSGWPRRPWACPTTQTLWQRPVEKIEGDSQGPPHRSHNSCS